MTWFAFPEDEGTTGSSDRDKWDKNAAANFATLIHEGNATDYVVSGFDVSYDETAGEATVSPGLARVSDTAATDHTEDEERDWGVTYAVGLSDPVTVSASDGDTLYLTLDPTQGDGGAITTTDSSPGIEIAEIDGDTATEVNRAPSATFEEAVVTTPPENDDDVVRLEDLDDIDAMEEHGNEWHTEDFATDQALTDHEAADSDVHGVPDTDSIAAQSDVDAKADDPHGNEAHDDDYTTTDTDASEFSGAAGEDGQVLTSDGSDASWQDGGGGGGGEPDALARQSLTDPSIPAEDVASLYDSVTEQVRDDAWEDAASSSTVWSYLSRSEDGAWQVTRASETMSVFIDQATARDEMAATPLWAGHLLGTPDPENDFWYHDEMGQALWDAGEIDEDGASVTTAVSGEWGPSSGINMSVTSNDPDDHNPTWALDIDVAEYDTFEYYSQDSYDSEWYVRVSVGTNSENNSAGWNTIDVSEYDGVEELEVEGRSNVTNYTSANVTVGDFRMN